MKKNENVYLSTKAASEKYQVDIKLIKKFVGKMSREDVQIKNGENQYRLTKEFKRLLKFGKGGCITKTTAMNEYKLSDAQIDKLLFCETKNPHYSCAKPMKLLLKDEVVNYLVKLVLREKCNVFKN
jgi:hypothetical protein